MNRPNRASRHHEIRASRCAGVSTAGSVVADWPPAMPHEAKKADAQRIQAAAEVIAGLRMADFSELLPLSLSQRTAPAPVNHRRRHSGGDSTSESASYANRHT